MKCITGVVLRFCLLFAAVAGQSSIEVDTTSPPDAEELVPTEFTTLLHQQQQSQNSSTDYDNEIIQPKASNYRQVLLAELEREVGNWTEPEELSRHYSYYLSGFDDEERPIWIAELGKYNMRRIAEAGPESTALFDKYVRKACLRMVRSHTMRNKLGNHLVYLLDFEGLEFSQLASIPTVTYLLKLARDYRKLLEDHTALVIIVNANYVTETLVNLVRPIFGRLLEIVEIYGNNKTKWLPQVLKNFPKSQIPEWYGGGEGYSPIAVYG